MHSRVKYLSKGSPLQGESRKSWKLERHTDDGLLKDGIMRDDFGKIADDPCFANVLVDVGGLKPKVK